MDFLHRHICAFIRLKKAHQLGDLTEVPVPSRFIFLLLGPTGHGQQYKEIGRAISTLMADEVNCWEWVERIKWFSWKKKVLFCFNFQEFFKVYLLRKCCWVSIVCIVSDIPRRRLRRQKQGGPSWWCWWVPRLRHSAAPRRVGSEYSNRTAQQTALAGKTKTG